MKKLLQLISSFLVTAPAATSVVSCTKNENWKIFQNITNDKNNNYIIMIDGADAQESKDMKSQLWNYLSSDPSKEAGDNNKNSDLINYGLSGNQKVWNTFVANNVPNHSSIAGKGNAKATLGDAGIKFVELKGEVASKLWDEDWAKNIMKWCAHKSWSLTTDSDLTSNQFYQNYEKKFEIAKPLFLYFSKGEYWGVHTFDGTWNNNQLAGDKSKNGGKVEAQVFYNWAYEQFIGHQGYAEDKQNGN